MSRKIQIGVIGSDADLPIDHRTLSLARELGRQIATHEAILVCGGGGGIMMAVAQGAKEVGGITVGVLPFLDKEVANEFIDVVICTGMGWGIQGGLLVRSVDGVIVVGGGCGTLAELAMAYMHEKPVVAIRGTGGWADSLAGKFLDDRQITQIGSATSAMEAVELIWNRLSVDGKPESRA